MLGCSYDPNSKPRGFPRPEHEISILNNGGEKFVSVLGKTITSDGVQRANAVFSTATLRDLIGEVGGEGILDMPAGTVDEQVRLYAQMCKSKTAVADTRMAYYEIVKHPIFPLDDDGGYEWKLLFLQKHVIRTRKLLRSRARVDVDGIYAHTSGHH